jgi:ribosomal protein L14E/L6E/L27E
MGKPIDDGFRMGQVVVSKRGKDAGHRYVIVGFLGGNRLALADADRFNADRPKPKNPKHVTPTPHVMNEAVACVEAGKNINRGELCRFLKERLRTGIERRGRAANGEQGSRK